MNQSPITLNDYLNDQDFSELDEILNKKTFKAGSYLFKAGDPGTSALLIQSGDVKVTLTNRENKEVEITQLSAGDMVGEMSLLTDHPRSSNVIALDDCTAYEWSKEDFKKLLKGNSEFSFHLLSTLAIRLERTTAKLANFHSLDVYRKIANYLNQSDHDQLPSSDELASIVGASRTLVDEALEKLQEDGFLKLEGNKVHVSAAI